MANEMKRNCMRATECAAGNGNSAFYCNVARLSALSREPMRKPHNNVGAPNAIFPAAGSRVFGAGLRLSDNIRGRTRIAREAAQRVERTRQREGPLLALPARS
jgi:hypothetical protein